MSSGRVVAVEGASAAGKTTAIETATREAGWAVVAEAYRRLDPPPSLEFDTVEQLVELECALLEEEARRYSEARDRAGGGATVVADTGFLGPLSYTWGLIEIGAAPRSALSPVMDVARSLHARSLWGIADAVVYLDTPPTVRSARARSDPTGHPPNLASRHARVGEVERRFYGERFAPLLGSRFRTVSGVGPAPLVARRLTKAIRAVVETHSSDGSTEAVLALFDGATGAPAPSRGNR
jgi:hypothetical protein